MQETRNNCFGSKNVARPFFRRKQLSTSAEMQRCCCISALVLNCFHLKNGRATFFDPKQLLRVSCIFWCYYPKCYSIIIKHIKCLVSITIFLYHRKIEDSCYGYTYCKVGRRLLLIFFSMFPIQMTYNRPIFSFLSLFLKKIA